MSSAEIQTSWWLDGSALPDLYWARLEVAEDGSAVVLDLDGKYHRFDDAQSARYWLQEDEYSLLHHLIEGGEIERSVVPPVAGNDVELIPLLRVKHQE